MFAGRVERGCFNQGQTQSGSVTELALNSTPGGGLLVLHSP